MKRAAVFSDTVTPRSGIREFFNRSGWHTRISIFALLLLTVVAVMPSLFSPFDPQVPVSTAFSPPSSAHWFGTDDIGRDLFSRVILGIHYTLLPGLAVILISLLTGATVGLIAGSAGGLIDFAMQRVTDLFLIMPTTLLALAVAAALGPGLWNIGMALSLAWWPWYATIARDETRRIRARPHFEAAVASETSRGRLMLRYSLPGVVPSLIVAAALDVSNVIMAFALMSFLGLGQPEPAPELGALTARALESLTAFWWLPLMPAAVVFLICLLANIAGDGVRAALVGR
jgi:peptide/nickel transport system permease protein